MLPIEDKPAAISTTTMESKPVAAIEDAMKAANAVNDTAMRMAQTASLLSFASDSWCESKHVVATRAHDVVGNSDPRFGAHWINIRLI